MVPEAKLVLINTKTKKVIGAHTDVNFLILMADAKMPYDDYYICACTVDFLKPFNSRELLDIVIANEPKGTKHNFKTRGEIEKCTVGIMYKTPLTTESPEMFQATIQKRTGNTKMTDLNQEVAQEEVATEAVAEAPATVEPVKVEQEKANGVTRPKAGSKTGRVWEIAEQLGEEVTRKGVVDTCVAEGINPSTASTQYGKWRKFNGMTAEKAKAKAVDAAPAEDGSDVVPAE